MECPIARKQPLFTNRALVYLIVPLIIEQLLAMTVGMADIVMLTTVSETAVSGVALVDVVNNLIIQVMAALATGGAVVISQYIGRQDLVNARDAAKQLFYFLTAFTIVVTIVSLSIRKQLLPFMFGSVEPDVMQNALVYFVLTSLSFPFLAMYNACAAIFRSMGNSKVSMFTSLIMNIINIGGNAILIYVCHWGAAGAATATLVSRAVSALVLLYLIHNRDKPVYLEKLFQIRLKKNMIMNILRVGVPGGVETGLFQIGKLTLQTLIASLGTAVIAANAILNSMASFMLVPGLAISLGMVTVVGQCVGAGDYHQTTAYVKKLMLWAYACMFCINAPALLFSKQLIGMFHLSDAATAMAVQILPFIGLTQMVLWPMSFALPNALRASGDARFTMLISIISMWVMRIGCGYLLVLVFHAGMAGVWYAMACDWLLRILFFVPRFLSGKWKTKCVIQ